MPHDFVYSPHIGHKPEHQVYAILVLMYYESASHDPWINGDPINQADDHTLIVIVLGKSSDFGFPRKYLYPRISGYLRIPMPTLLVKNVPEALMRELRKLKAELGCRTWAELLEKLVKLRSKEVIVIGEEDLERMKRAIDEFLDLRNTVTERWGKGTVLEEIRRARRHEAENPNTRC